MASKHFKQNRIGIEGYNTGTYFIQVGQPPKLTYFHVLFPVYTAACEQVHVTYLRLAPTE